MATRGPFLPGSFRPDPALQAQFPDEPWKWRRTWVEGRGQPREVSEAQLRAFMGIMTLLMTSPMYFRFHAEMARKGPIVFIALLFPLAGFHLLFGAFRAWIKARSFGKTNLNLETLPAILGGQFKGELTVGYGFRSAKPIQVQLDCVRITVTGGKDSVHRDVKWQEKWSVQPAVAGSQSSLLVEIEIPYDLPATDESNPRDQVEWAIWFSDEESGFNASFKIPVFKTANSDAAKTEKTLEEKRASLADVALVPIRGYQVTPEGERSIYRMVGHTTGSPGAAMFLVGALFFCMGIGMAAVSYRAGSIFNALWLMTLVFTPFGLLLLSLGFGEIFGRSSLVVEPGRLIARRHYFGLTFSRVIESQSVEGIELTSQLKSGDRLWYDLKLKRRDSAKFGTTISCRISDKREAELLVADLEKKLAA